MPPFPIRHRLATRHRLVSQKLVFPGSCRAPRRSEESLQHADLRWRERRDARGQQGAGQDEGLLSGKLWSLTDRLSAQDETWSSWRLCCVCRKFAAVSGKVSVGRASQTWWTSASEDQTWWVSDEHVRVSAPRLVKLKLVERKGLNMRIDSYNRAAQRQTQYERRW